MVTPEELRYMFQLSATCIQSSRIRISASNHLLSKSHAIIAQSEELIRLHQNDTTTDLISNRTHRLEIGPDGVALVIEPIKMDFQERLDFLRLLKPSQAVPVSG